MDQNVTVLSVSTRGNIISDGNGGGAPPSVKTRGVKLPGSIAIRSVRSVGGSAIKKECDADAVQLGQPGDDENIPPQQGKRLHHVQAKLPLITVEAKAMTYDQQSQTDAKMFEGGHHGKYDNSMPLATAAQQHQQSMQIAQLIRANNGLVMEVRQLNDVAEQLDAKLSRVLGLLQQGGQGLGQGLHGRASGGASTASYTEELEVHEPYATGVAEVADAGAESYTLVYDEQPTSLKRCSTKSENTPPLKKNKLKLQAAEQEAAELLEEDGEFAIIGANGTRVPKSVLQGLPANNFSQVTRKILMAVFDRDVLASHSLTGKPSPAFLDRGAKMQLDPRKVQDIVDYVGSKCHANEANIRAVITSKCADENKMQRLKKRGSGPPILSAQANKRRTMH